MSIITYIIIGLFILFALITIILLFKLIKANQLEPTIIKFITEAENLYNSGEGNLKFDYVFDKVYNTFAPKIVKLLFSANEIKGIIQFVFNKIKIALDYKGE